MALVECIARVFARCRGLSGPALGQPRASRRAEFQQAETLLRENLEGEDLTPDSHESRDSLFALGECCTARAATRRRLSAWTRRSSATPTLPQEPAARYLFADSCRRGAAGAFSQRLRRRRNRPRSGAAAAATETLREKSLLQHRRVVEELGPPRRTELTAAGQGDAPQQPLRDRRGLLRPQRYEEAAKAYTAAATVRRHAPRPWTPMSAWPRPIAPGPKPGEARSTLQRPKPPWPGFAARTARFDETTNLRPPSNGRNS